MAQAISLAMFEGPAPEPVASAALALSWVRTARSIEPRAQSAASFAGLLIERTLERHCIFSMRTRKASTGWTTCAVMHCTESCVGRGMREARETLINAGDLL